MRDNAVNLLIAVLASLRVTRFITTDYLGHWWLVGPARRWALQRQDRAYHQGTVIPRYAGWAEAMEDDDENWSKSVKLVKGLDCPFCVGFWTGAVVLLSLAIARAVPPLLPLWRFVAGAFALNYLVGHVSSRIDG